jgi:hypothetical protein
MILTTYCNETYMEVVCLSFFLSLCHFSPLSLFLSLSFSLILPYIVRDHGWLWVAGTVESGTVDKGVSLCYDINLCRTSHAV